MLDAMTARGKKISELAAELPRYEIRKTTVKLRRKNFPPLWTQFRSFSDAQPTAAMASGWIGRTAG